MKPTRRSTLFLMELIMAILLFSLASTVCVQVFVKSHTLEKESNELSQAVFVSTSIAEIFRSSVDYDALLYQEFPHIISDNNTYLIYYNDSFSQVVSEKDSSYCLKFVTAVENNYETGHIYVYKTSTDSSLIYEVNLKKYSSKGENQI